MKKRWTDKECEFLKANYSNMSPHDCALNLNKSAYAVKQKAKRLGLARTRNLLSVQSIDYIKKHYAENGSIALSHDMNIPATAIHNIAYRAGIKMTLEARGKISTKTNTGRIMSDETKQKIGDGNRKYDSPVLCLDCGTPLGKRISTRCRVCNLKSRAGENHMWWQGGVSSINQIVRRRLYPIWNFPVLERDDFQCVDCGTTGYLEVHHLIPYQQIRDSIIADNPNLSIDVYEERLELAELIIAEHKIENGITLCRACHEARHWEKQDELLGTLNEKDEGNQQPSMPNVNDLVGMKVQRLTDKESQPISPTRASCTLLS